MFERVWIVWHFVWTRWFSRTKTRGQLLATQQRKLNRFLQTAVSDSPFYKGMSPELSSLPVMTKAEFLANFAALNRYGVTLQAATEAALRAEREREFRPVLPHGITVGLSSGTSGARHVFLVMRSDRCRWAGQMLARVLSTESLRRVLNPFVPALRIAFFLRANSNLYRTISGRRVQLDYYDLTRPFDELIARLRKDRPHVLVAPATVLAEIARRETRERSELAPRQIISVAEVLDSRDRAEVESVFQVRVDEIYQATEGFLGSSCRAGRIHLHEDALHIETEWLDDSRERFQPIITDFSRATQWFIRHRLTDILVIDKSPCPCGSATISLRRIEGRQEEVLWARSALGVLSPVFPDALRQALYAASDAPELYRIEQHGTRWEVSISPETDSVAASVRDAIDGLLDGLALEKPVLEIRPWSEQPAGEKQRRIRCVTKPE